MWSLFQTIAPFFPPPPRSSFSPFSSPHASFHSARMRWTWICVMIMERKSHKKRACCLNRAVLLRAGFQEVPACLWYHLIWWREEPWDTNNFKLKPTDLPSPSTYRYELKNLCKRLALNPALVVGWGLVFFLSLDPISNVLWWWSVKFVETTSSGPFLQQISSSSLWVGFPGLDDVCVCVQHAVSISAKDKTNLLVLGSVTRPGPLCRYPKG